MKTITNKQKGDLLEEIVEKLCSEFSKSKVARNIIIKGKSGIDRQIDVLIEATQKSFDIKIIIEAKNYSSKVSIEKVEALRTKLLDVGGNLGVIVCPLGFTKGAINSARLHDIQLFQVFDHKLGNTNQFIPLQYIIPYIKAYQLTIQHGAIGGTFSLPSNPELWNFYIDKKWINIDELATYAWNKNMFPKLEGEQSADFGIQKICDKSDLSKFYYLELKLNIIISANYYLKLFPASFMKNIQSSKGNHALYIDTYSKKDDMIKNGWRYFNSKEEMEKEAKVHEESEDIKELRITEDYIIG